MRTVERSLLLEPQFNGRTARHASVIALICLLLCFGPAAVAQGSFRITITGKEIQGGQTFPVSGSGSLQLYGTTIGYSIRVPVAFVRPAEAHFHGPAVGGETPIISLLPYLIPAEGGIMYYGTQALQAKYLPDILAGKWYINLHSPNYENGVLTGSIIPVPEPSAALILVMGVVIGGSRVFHPRHFRSQRRANLSCV